MNKGEIEMLTKKMLKDAAECVALKYNMNKLEQTIRDLRLYNDVGWDEINDMFNFALTALKDFCKLQQENEQLRAQVARVREALRKARETISAWDSWFECDRCKNMRDALATINKALGGKEDV